MKYNQPYGVSDPNGAYVNGNPSTGTMGSIPPAASIEYPQREIVKLINSAVKADLSGPLYPPDNADLAQLAKGVQSNLMNSARDTGTQNNYACNLNPPIIAYFEGFEVTLKIAHDNTGPSVLNVNACGNKPIVTAGSVPLVGGMLRAGIWQKFKYDGVNFQMVWTPGLVAGQPVYLTEPKEVWVNNAVGNDGYDGRAAAFTSGVTGPFKTLQRAADEIGKYNLNNFTFTVHVADGTYTNVVMRKFAGSGAVYWQGNQSNPANVLIDAADNNSAIDGLGNMQGITIDGFKVRSMGVAAGNVMGGIFAGGGTVMTLRNIDYGPCRGTHLLVSRGAYCALGPGTFYISGSCGIGGSGTPASGGNHLWCYNGGEIEGGGNANMVITTPVNIPNFVNCQAMGLSAYMFTSWTGYNNVTGQKFIGGSNSVINVLGGGLNYYPGTIAGVLYTGCQYG